MGESLAKVRAYAARLANSAILSTKKRFFLIDEFIRGAQAGLSMGLSSHLHMSNGYLNRDQPNWHAKAFKSLGRRHIREDHRTQARIDLGSAYLSTKASPSVALDLAKISLLEHHLDDAYFYAKQARWMRDNMKISRWERRRALEHIDQDRKPFGSPFTTLPDHEYYGAERNLYSALHSYANGASIEDAVSTPLEHLQDEPKETFFLHTLEALLTEHKNEEEFRDVFARARAVESEHPEINLTLHPWQKSTRQTYFLKGLPGLYGILLKHFEHEGDARKAHELQQEVKQLTNFYDKPVRNVDSFGVLYWEGEAYQMIEYVPEDNFLWHVQTKLAKQKLYQIFKPFKSEEEEKITFSTEVPYTKELRKEIDIYLKKTLAYVAFLHVFGTDEDKNQADLEKRLTDKLDTLEISPDQKNAMKECVEVLAQQSISNESFAIDVERHPENNALDRFGTLITWDFEARPRMPAWHGVASTINYFGKLHQKEWDKYAQFYRKEVARQYTRAEHFIADGSIEHLYDPLPEDRQSFFKKVFSKPLSPYYHGIGYRTLSFYVAFKDKSQRRRGLILDNGHTAIEHIKHKFKKTYKANPHVYEALLETMPSLPKGEDNKENRFIELNG